MKKVLLVSALVLTIVTSMVSGTLALYQTSIDDQDVGSVVAKKFVLVVPATSSFTTSVPIAPGETQYLTFDVSNTDDTGTAEVEMALSISVEFISDDTPPLPLTAVLNNSDASSTDSLITSTGTISVTDKLTTLTGEGDTRTCTVAITWPDSAQGVYQKPAAYTGLSTTLKVTVVGTQIA